MTFTLKTPDRQETLKRWAGWGALVALLLGLVVMVRSGLPYGRKAITHMRAAARLNAAGAQVITDDDDHWDGRFRSCSVYASSRRVREPIDDKLLATLRELENVESVSFTNCGRITDAGLAAFESLTTLKHLDLGGDAWPPHITDAGLDHLKGLTSLISLSLVGTQITDAGLAKLAGLKDLEELDLEGTQVTDASLPRLMTLFPKLKMVTLARTKVTREGLWQLLQAHHTLEIHDDGELDAMHNQFGEADGAR
jgi:hypothetical protein